MYPNEELLRFFGSYYFGLPPEARRRLRMLEVGCGSGANLWMIAREGFEAHGLDLSQDGLTLCEEMLRKMGFFCFAKQGDMTNIDYERDFSTWSSMCFHPIACRKKDFDRFLYEVSRVLNRRTLFLLPSIQKQRRLP